VIRGWMLCGVRARCAWYVYRITSRLVLPTRIVSHREGAALLIPLDSATALALDYMKRLHGKRKGGHAQGSDLQR
jgi:hypothetical protein